MGKPSIAIQIETANIHVHKDALIPGGLIDLSASTLIRREAGERFELVLDGQVVMDHDTGLMWAADVSDEINWDDAFKYCRDFRLGGFNDWRMASLHERIAIIDFDRHKPAMHPHFKACDDCEWTAKPTHWTEGKTGVSRSLWYVGVNYGYVGYGNALLRDRARPVRVASPAGQ